MAQTQYNLIPNSLYRKLQDILETEGIARLTEEEKGAFRKAGRREVQFEYFLKEGRGGYVEVFEEDEGYEGW